MQQISKDVRYWMICASVLGMLLIGLFGAAIVQSGLLDGKEKTSIPKVVKDQLLFTAFVPDGQNTSVKKDSFAYDPEVKVLTYITSVDGIDVTVSQQAVPDEVASIPVLYDKMLANIGTDNKFESRLGTVYFTKSGALKDQYVAVLKTKGVLVYAQSSIFLKQMQWQKVFDSFQIQ